MRISGSGLTGPRTKRAVQVVDELRGLKIDRAAVCSTRSVFVNWEDGNCETEDSS